MRDAYFALSDAELLEAIRELTLAIAAPEQFASTNGVGSFSNKPVGELRIELAAMQRAYAVRIGVAVRRPGPRFRPVVIMNGNYE